MKKRIVQLDFAKSIAIVSVILAHVIISNPYEKNIPTLVPCPLYILSVIGVPIFMMCTGALIMDKEFDCKKTVIYFYKKNLLTIFLTAEIWNIVYLIINPNTTVDVFKIVRTLFLIDKPAVHLWYVRMILLYYLFMPILVFLLKHEKTLFMSIVTISFLVTFCRNGYFIYIGYDYPTTSGLSIMCYLPYLYIGKQLKNITIPTFVLILLASFSFGTLLFTEHNRNYFLWYDNPVVLLLSASIYGLVMRCKVENECIVRLSQWSFGIYLIHMLPLLLYGDMIWKEHNEYFQSALVAFIAAFAFSIISIAVLSKSKIGKILFRI